MAGLGYRLPAQLAAGSVRSGAESVHPWNGFNSLGGARHNTNQREGIDRARDAAKPTELNAATLGRAGSAAPDRPSQVRR
jgi:hypothetical protein